MDVLILLGTMGVGIVVGIVAACMILSRKLTKMAEHVWWKRQ
jgi:MFS superfamily sulfate permease-like transporter